MKHHAPITDTPRQIEAQLDQDRDALSASLEALAKRFSVDSLWSNGTSLLKANAGDYTQALDAAVRANPVALGLSAVGLAWLILGRRSQPRTEPSPLAGTGAEAEMRWEDEGGPAPTLPESDFLWMEDADRVRLRANTLIARINAALRDKHAPAVELEKNREDVLASLTKDLRRVMLRGLDNMTSGALDAALSARERAYTQRIATEKAGAETVRDHPVVAGLALVAAGAAIAVLIPQSDHENRIFAAPRARVMGEVKRLLGYERRRMAQSAKLVAQALTTEIAPPASQSAVTAADRARWDKTGF